MRRFNSSPIAAHLFMSSKKLADANVYSQTFWFTQTVGFIILAIINISFSTPLLSMQTMQMSMESVYSLCGLSVKQF